jgi:hypothetical protein
MLAELQGAPAAMPASATAPEWLTSEFLPEDIWSLSTERFYEEMGRLRWILSAAQEKDDLRLAERAHCATAVVFAVRGDLPRATERLGQARSLAASRGDTADVDQVEEYIRALPSRRAMNKSLAE